MHPGVFQGDMKSIQRVDFGFWIELSGLSHQGVLAVRRAYYFILNHVIAGKGSYQL